MTEQRDQKDSIAPRWIMAGKRLLSALVCLALICLGTGCGGGTSGTGLQTFDGQVKSADGAPIAGARVTLTATGDAAVTDVEGRFVLQSSLEIKPEQRVEFLLQADDFSGTFVMPDGAVSEGSSQITIDLVVDPVSRTLELTNFTLQVQMIGRCAAAFSNGEVVRQIAEVPAETRCTLSVELKGNGLLRGDIPVVLQYRPCTGKKGVWKNLYTARTGVAADIGRVELPFSFVDSDKFCRYRVVAPHDYRDYRAAFFGIDTLGEQAAQSEILPTDLGAPSTETEGVD